MQFCNNCGTILLRKDDFRCIKCNPSKNDNLEIINDNKVSDSSFPYVKNQYYVQKEIRTNLGTDMMSGISWDKTRTFLVLFRNARKPEPKQSNVYHDKFDRESGLYHYTGKGRTGDQTLSGINGELKNSKNNKIKVHLFWQYNFNSNHQYVGEVEVIETKQDLQPDSSGNNRRVHVFLLKPSSDLTN